MATKSLTKPKLFDEEELEIVSTELSIEAVDLDEAFLSVVQCESDQFWEEFASWTSGDGRKIDVDIDMGFGKPMACSLWERSKDSEMISNGKSPIFMFLCVPDPITDNKRAWRELLCTLICEIADFITHVPAEKLGESGVYGGKFVQRYLCQDVETTGTLVQGNTDQTIDHVKPLFEFLSALRHCEFDEGHENVNYAYVVIIEGFERLRESSDPSYMTAFDEVVKETLINKMGAYVIFLNEKAKHGDIQMSDV